MVAWPTRPLSQFIAYFHHKREVLILFCLRNEQGMHNIQFNICSTRVNEITGVRFIYGLEIHFNNDCDCYSTLSNAIINIQDYQKGSKFLLESVHNQNLGGILWKLYARCLERLLPSKSENQSYLRRIKREHFLK